MTDLEHGWFEECCWLDCEDPAVDELGFCGHHHWMYRAEITEGMAWIRRYLNNWARFGEWAATHDR